MDLHGLLLYHFFLFLVAPTLESLLPLLEHRAQFSQFLNQGHSVGLLGRVISSSHFLTTLVIYFRHFLVFLFYMETFVEQVQ
jgi:hypothetical protein